ncbi:MAG: sulfurtransferase TusA family protein [Candidatus Limiplasma sp.]|nr:sulfurtransferase TusA family protein [Candidatus Limiplasma sp.]
MEKKLIDARGLSCPEPVLLTKQALAENAAGDFQVAVSSATARDNVAALLESKGFSPVVEEARGEWLISISK